MKLPIPLHNFLVDYIIHYVPQAELKDYTRQADFRPTYESYVSDDTLYPRGVELYVSKLEADGQIITFLAGLYEKRKEDVDYAQFYEKATQNFVKAAGGEWKWSAAAFTHPLVKNNLPFIGRREIMKAVERLVNGEIEDVIVMDGKPRSGLSYIKYYLSHIAERCQCFNFIYVNIRDLSKVYPNELISAVHVADFLSLELHLDFRMQEFKLHPFVTRLKSFLDEKIRQGQTYLVYFDQFDEPIGKDVKELISELAEKAIVANTKSYLIIADFDEYQNWPFEIQAIVEYIDIEKGSFTEEQINEFLEILYLNQATNLSSKINKATFVQSAKQFLSPELFQHSEEPNVTRVGRILTTWYKGIQKKYAV